MKKLFLMLAASAVVASASAEGYQVNVQSTKQTGMGHVGAAQKLGAESQHFNPAGMAFMDNAFDASLGAAAIYANSSFTNDASGLKTKNNVSASTPMYAYVASKLTDGLVAGVSVTTPYGSSLDWAETWDGDGLVKSISLQTFSIQPTVAIKLSERLSVGAGLILSFGSVELSRNLDSSNIIGANLTGDSNTSVGYNLGIMFDATEKLTLGGSFRSKMMLQVNDGDLALTLQNPPAYLAPTLSAMIPESVLVAAQMPMPANMNIGASYRLNDDWLFALEFQQTFWSEYKELDIQLDQPILGETGLVSAKGYKNSFALRAGAERTMSDKLTLRAGVYYDQSPVPSDNINPETPSMDKIGVSAGVSYKFIDRLSVDFAMLYIHGLSRSGSITYDTIDLSKFAKVSDTLAGEYTAIAFSPTLGVSYSF